MFFTKSGILLVLIVVIIGAEVDPFNDNTFSKAYATFLIFSEPSPLGNVNLDPYRNVGIDVLQEYSMIETEDLMHQFLAFSVEFTCLDDSRSNQRTESNQRFEPCMDKSFVCEAYFDTDGEGNILRNVTNCLPVENYDDQPLDVEKEMERFAMEEEFVPFAVEGETGPLAEEKHTDEFPAVKEDIKPLAEEKHEQMDPSSGRVPVVEEPIVPVRNSLCLGCEITLNLEEESIMKLAASGMERINELGVTAGEPYKKVVKVTQAKKQVVNGIKYILDVMFVTSSYDETTNEPQSCTMELLIQPWLKPEPEVLSHTCQVENNDLENELIPNEMLNMITSDESSTSRVENSTAKENRNRRDVNNNFLKNVGKEEMDEVKLMADYAMDTLDQIDVDDHKRVVLAVEDAKKQLTDGSGIMYLLTLKTVQTGCEEGKSSNAQCLSEHVSPVKMCEIHLLRSWADPTDSPINARVVKTRCSPEQRSEDVAHKRIRREPKERLVGAPAQIDFNAEGVQAASQFALDKINEGSTSSAKLGVLKIVSATHQIVSGSLYTIKLQVSKTSCPKSGSSGQCEIVSAAATESDPDFNECTVQVWDQPWLTPRYKLTKLKCSRDNASQMSGRRRGLDTRGVSVDVKDAQVKEAAQFAVSQISGGSESGHKWNLLNIVSATRQTVSGSLYILTLQVAKTNCSKSASADPCEPLTFAGTKNDPDFNECTVKVWDQPWLTPRHKVTEFNCKGGMVKQKLARKRRESVGFAGPTHVDVNEPDVKLAADAAINQINQVTNLTEKSAIVKILSASRRVVSGSLYTLTIQVAKTDCKKSEGAPKLCQPMKSSGSKNNLNECTVKVWDQPWLTPRHKVTELKCPGIIT